jgi:hypothetical protein
MKLSSAVALVAQQMSLSDCQLRTIARTVAERRANAARPEARPAPAPRSTSFDPAEPDEHGRSVHLSLLASQSLLTRTINMLK